MMMYMKKLYLILLFCLACPGMLLAQGFDYDEKEPLLNDLYKVRSGKAYGIVDGEDNVVVSIEYQNLLFREGLALMTKEDVLWGVVDLKGNVTELNGEYKVHPVYRYVYEGYIPVAHVDKWAFAQKWGYIDLFGRPYRVSDKIKGVVSAGKNYPSLFDEVTPIVEGIACVYLARSGWKHVDMVGYERFRLPSMSLFRTSLYDGECLVVSHDGIKLFQENGDRQAVVKKVLSESAVFQKDTLDNGLRNVIFSTGTIVLDSLERAIKYMSGDDELVFIAPVQTVEEVVVPDVQPVDTLSARNHLKVSLSSKNLQANSSGRANVKIKISNIAEETFDKLTLYWECAGANGTKEVSVDAKGEVQIPISLPARFSSTSVRRTVLVSLTYEDEEPFEQELSVSIKRYTPTM